MNFFDSLNDMGHLPPRSTADWQSTIVEVPKRQRLVFRPSLDELLSSEIKGNRERRNQVIREAYLEYGYSMPEIAKHLGLHYATVGRIIKASLL